MENKPLEIVKREELIKFNRDERRENVLCFPVLEPELYTLRYLLHSNVPDSKKYTKAICQLYLELTCAVLAISQRISIEVARPLSESQIPYRMSPYPRLPCVSLLKPVIEILPMKTTANFCVCLHTRHTHSSLLITFCSGH